MDRQLIRLIVTPDKGNDGLISEAVGVGEQRFREIEREVFEMLRNPDFATVSLVMRQITEVYLKDAELALALYALGTLIQKSNCLACQLQGFIKLL